MTAAATPTVPLTVIGGFLDAGKTTLLNRLLADNHGVRYAVLVNDFGDLAIDGDLVAAHDGETLTLANGCICCSMGDDLLAALIALMQRPDRPQHIVVEASGVADPRPIADIGELHPGLRRDLTIVLADAASLPARAADGRLADTVHRQLAAADLVVVNKCDLADAEALAAAQAVIAAAAPEAAAVETAQARLPLARLFDPAPTRTGAPSAAAHRHGDLFRAVTVHCPAPFDRTALSAALSGLPSAVLRAKGFVRLTDTPGRRHLLQLAGGHIELTDWDGDAGGACDLVFIGAADMPTAHWFAGHFDARASDQAKGSTA